MPQKRTRQRKPVKKTEWSSSRETRSRTAQRRAKEERERLTTARRQEEELLRRREKALNNRPPAPAGSRGDGNFHMAFLQMGQGDCCVMATPRGRIVMIDCGSDSREEDDGTFVARVHSVLYKKKFLRTTNNIDVLILTHPDTDHYNHLKQVLNDGTRFIAIYHSSARTGYSEGQTSGWLLARVEQDRQIYRVQHHSNAGSQVIKLNDDDVAPADKNQTINRLDNAGGIRVIDEPNCKISILAGGVAVDYKKDKSNITNRGSVVTMIEVFGEKILMCGDATRSTEHYVLTRHANRIRRVDLAQAGHHGSDLTSSSPAYVTQVEPELVIVSAGKNVRKDHLPSQEVINRYLDRMGRATLIADHEIFFWKKGGLKSYYNTSKFIKYPLRITGSWSTYYYSLGPTV
jgi:beta-lactamase superfamily II metal-dependent hydrolase